MTQPLKFDPNIYDSGPGAHPVMRGLLEKINQQVNEVMDQVAQYSAVNPECPGFTLYSWMDAGAFIDQPGWRVVAKPTATLPHGTIQYVWGAPPKE